MFYNVIMTLGCNAGPALIVGSWIRMNKSFELIEAIKITTLVTKTSEDLSWLSEFINALFIFLHATACWI